MGNVSSPRRYRPKGEYSPHDMGNKDIEALHVPDGARREQQRGAAAVTHATIAGEEVARALVGRTVAEVERELILETLKHCLGNRTHAANVLGISIRTLRNKLNEYSADGVAVPPPGGGGERFAVAALLTTKVALAGMMIGIVVEKLIATGL